MTTGAFSELTAPFADTLELLGASGHDFNGNPHFLFVLNSSDESAEISFPNSQSLVVAGRKGYLFFVNADGDKIISGPTDISDES